MRELYLKTLKKEVVPSEGCTEPIAIAYAASIAAEHLKGEIKEVNIYLSKNVIKKCLRSWNTWDWWSWNRNSSSFRNLNSKIL